MKKILLLFYLITSFTAFSQNSYFVDKKGVKTFMRDEAIIVILIDNRISYILPGKTWEKYIKFDDLDYAIIGSSCLKSFKLNHKGKSKLYYVFAEKQDQRLIGIATTVTVTNGNLSSSHTTYELYVIDKDDNIIDELRLESGNTKSRIADRTKVAPMIKKYFSDCPMLMSKLQEYDHEDGKNESIFGFFYDTDYINCKL